MLGAGSLASWVTRLGSYCYGFRRGDGAAGSLVGSIENLDWQSPAETRGFEGLKGSHQPVVLQGALSLTTSLDSSPSMFSDTCT